jgi:predicted MFS family arabinose efflux permease
MSRDPPASLKPWQVVLAGIVSLAVAMGIGRFAFTPLLPMMLADGVIDLQAASWLASANYLGYMLGALLCTVQPWLWRTLRVAWPIQAPALVRAGLVATVLLTLGMALRMPTAWPWMRLAAGVASALVFVYTSGWCLAQLARLNQPATGALIYTGPGSGIVLSGLAASAMVNLQGTAALGWLIFGVLAAVLTSVVWQVFSPRLTSAPASNMASHPAHAGESKRMHGRVEVGLLAVAYGLAGLGYIVTATFLPVIARQALPGSPWLDLFWPVFGVGGIAGALIASRMRPSGDLRWRLAGCYMLQALGIGSSLIYPTLGGFVIGSLLLGLPFTVISFFGMQEARRLRPEQASSLMGLMTAVYGLGQIAGPPLVAAVLSRSTSLGAGFSLSLEIAAATLVLGAALYGVMIRFFPLRHAPTLLS